MPPSLSNAVFQAVQQPLLLVSAIFLASYLLLRLRPVRASVLAGSRRYDTLGVNGTPGVQTPFLDGMAQDGAVFHQSFCTTPLCSPARASFLTGLYPYRHGVLNHAERAAWDDGHVT